MMKQRIYIFLLTLLTCVNAAWAKVQTVNDKTYNVVYMSSTGAGNKSGDDAANAVSGWANAYNKLSKTGGTYEDDWNYNIIVIVSNIRINTTEANTKDIPATITNVWPWEDNSGNSSVSGSKVSNGNKLTLDGGARENRIGAPTRFKNVCFTSSGKDCRMSLFLHHAMFDVGCVMNNMSTLETTNGAMDKTTHKAPSFHMMLFSDENDFTAAGSSNNAAWTQTEPMDLTIRSGKFGRILCTRIAGTNWSSQTSKRYTVGKPDQPLMAKIEVDIDPSTNTSDFNPTGYKDDIAFLCAGTTQGTVFADMQMDIKRGQIASIVGGSQGNAIAVCSQNGIPTSTYCGRSTVNVIGENDSDVKIFRYYGGCLGRFTENATGTCSAYFYGHSTINLVHGTIEQDVFASGGGLSGLRNPNNGDQHTSDQFIPYQGGSNHAYPFLGIDYSSYDASKNIVQITSVLKGTSEVIDLADTKIVTNMSGGVVKGNVYGGSYGYSSEMVLKGAPEGAGSLWGNTEVNISGGEIQGNVYGGGAGAKSYYNLATTDADRAKFLTVATVYGNTNLTITGKPTILGDIYGGGAGLPSQAQGATDVINVAGTETTKTGLPANEFLNIAKVYGNTNVLIDAADDWEYTGSIYGGGALGAVEGATNVIIKGGKITGNVFGGGLGEEGHTDKAKVIGNTEANIQGGTQGDEYAVYGGAQMALVDGNTGVILQGGTVGNAYGGGLGTNTMAANVTGNATVQLGSNDGTTASKVLGSIYGANNLNGTPQGHAKVHVLKTTPRDGQGSEEYDVAAVYGGGNLAAYVPTDENDFAEVLIENCDNSIEYVYGGGNAAPVPATEVTIKGANAIDNAFAGGNGAGADNPGADIGYQGFFSSGAVTEYGTGIATINVQGGTIHHVYGGSNTLGYIKDHAEVNVNAAGTCTMDVAELYGGGKMAPGKAATINISCTGEGKIDNVYGGAHMADLTGNIELNIRGGNIGNAFGGNNESGNINGAITVNVDWATGPEACGTNSLANVYGGGNLAPYTTPDGKVGPTVNLKNGTVSNNVYGGGYGEAAVVTGSPIVNLMGGTVTNDIFGGGDAAPVVGNPQVNANYGAVKDIFAGGRGSTAVVTGDPLAYINKTDEKTLTIVDVYGGGDAANVVGTGNVQLDKGTVANIYGGGNAADVVNTDVVINGGVATMAFAGGHGDKTAEPQTEANVTGDAHLTIHGGTVAQAFAGSNSKGTITGEQLVTIVKDANALAELHVSEVYGGGNQADGKAGTFDIGCTGGETEGIGDLFGGAREANITGDVAFTIEGGKIGRIFGGNNVSGNVDGSITVNIAENTTKYACGLHAGYVYGGGQDAAYTPAAVGSYPAVNIIGGTIANDVFGGGLGASATVTSNPTVTISGGSVGNTVFGGGSLAKTDGDPTVNVSGGTVTHDVYGGGALADVTGNTTVSLTGGAVGGAYGGALGSAEVAAKVNGDTYVHLDGSQVTESGVFGANNLNGTPTGHVKVYVTRTAPRDGEVYDVPAVYGGGNLSAYVPDDDNGFAEVLIENCDNSINYVYGGGNAAPVPATQVTIYGANAINHAFAGGNGAGVGNPGADVGFLGYYSIVGDANTYGTGTSSITIYGGTVHNVYGGSNTLGYIRGGTSVSVENGDGDCPLVVGNVFGGGNEADIDCSVTMNLDCNEGGAVLYAGANNANVHGDITLNIHSGTYGKVFCGNNTGGKIFGDLKVNVDETGCWPVMIGELYACGNLAPYSVYGYDGEGNILTEGDAPTYHDPEINLISFTRIGKVFGGGYGNTAVLYGDTHVNVEPIKGKFAGYDGNTAEKQISPAFVLNGNDQRVRYTEATTLPYGISKNGSYLVIPDAVGSIGSIYGGGNAGAVYGNTHVNIGLNTTNKHLNADPASEGEEVAVTITGNVFGGGNEAIVSGDTNVKIGEK